MLSVAWTGQLLFSAPAGLPTLLLVSLQSLYAWSGEPLLVAVSVQGAKSGGRAAVWRGSHWPCGCLTYIYITYKILTKIIIILYLLWSDEISNHTVPWYSCNNITLKMATITIETHW